MISVLVSSCLHQQSNTQIGCSTSHPVGNDKINLILFVFLFAIAVQKAISGRLNAIAHKLQTEQEYLELLNRQKDCLLNQMFI